MAEKSGWTALPNWLLSVLAGVFLTSAIAGMQYAKDWNRDYLQWTAAHDAADLAFRQWVTNEINEINGLIETGQLKVAKQRIDTLEKRIDRHEDNGHR